jgi:uncharacterized protein YdaU (DUF1376 family)
MSRAWMPMYWGDYLADTLHFSTEEHGAYLLLIAYYWCNGGLPPDDDDIRKITKCSRYQWKKMRDHIYKKFDRSGGTILHKRLDRELAKYLEKSRVNSANAKRKHADRHGISLAHPDPDPDRIDKKEKAHFKNGNGSKRIEKQKPEHCQTSKSGRIWCDVGTMEFTAYAEARLERRRRLVQFQGRASLAMSRRRLRQAKHRLEQQQKIHDRTAAILPLNAKIVIDTVDDAYGIPEFAAYDDKRRELVSSGRPKVTVIRSIRADPLGALKAQGIIDEVQFLAGQIWGWSYLRAEIGALKAVDMTAERVDGGRLSDPTEQVKRATAYLRAAERALGRDGQSLVTDVIGKGLTLSRAADARGISTKSGREYIGRRFRECLDCLAVVFGCATAGGSSLAAHKV